MTPPHAPCMANTRPRAAYGQPPRPTLTKGSRSVSDTPLSADAVAIIKAVHETAVAMQARLSSIEEQQELLLRGFPGGDVDGHRRFHESLIEWRELRNKMVKEALVHAAKVGGIGATGWVLYAIWLAIKMEMIK